MGKEKKKNNNKQWKAIGPGQRARKMKQLSGFNICSPSGYI